MTESSTSGVKFSRVVKRYDSGADVIHGIDLEIHRGEFVVFVGPSGCGKSTLMRMVAGLESITSGSIEIEGRVVNDLPPRERDIAMVFQDYALYPHKSVFENLAFGLRLRKTHAADIDRRVNEAAEILKITHLLERKPRALSGGQRQRVAMGRAIVRKPKLFLFDEPLSNLDALLRAEMRTEIKKLHQRIGATTIYVTHDQVEAMTLAERIVVLSEGKIMQVGTPDDIYHRPQSKFVAGFTGSPPMNFLAVQVVDAQGKLAIGDQQVALTDALANVVRERVGQPVEFGLRPEDISLTTDTEHSVTAQVVVVEPLGAEILVTFAIAGSEIIARLPPDTRLRPGEATRLRFNMGKAQLFDPTSGAALRAT